MTYISFRKRSDSGFGLRRPLRWQVTRECVDVSAPKVTAPD
jgi:hypothetical protein